MSGAALRPVAGDGLLSRRGELVLLCGTSAESEQIIVRMLALHEQVADAGGDGSELADGLVDVLAGAAHEVSVVAFGPARGSLVVAVFGHAWADVATEHGEQRLALQHSRDGVRSVLPGALLSIRAGIGDVEAAAAPQRWSELGRGTVHAGGLVYSAAPPGDPSAGSGFGSAPAPRAPRAEPPEMSSPSTADIPVLSVEPAAPPEPVAQAPTPPEQQLDRSRPFSSVLLLAADPEAAPQSAARAPLPVAEPAPAAGAPPPQAAGDDRPKVIGVYCKNGHFDDPSARYCAICGISMAQQTLLPRLGPRPPLGVLVLDDGRIFSLDADYLIGRDPSGERDVASATTRELRIDDPDAALSRVHALIKLDGWQVEVVDLGSTNGTGVWGPGEHAWVRIPPRTAVAIRPGTQVGFGRRQLRYESHRNT